MEAQAKICILHMLELQDRLAAIVDRLCNEASMDPAVRVQVIDSTKFLRESIKKMAKTVSH